MSILYANQSSLDIHCYDLIWDACLHLEGPRKDSGFHLTMHRPLCGNKILHSNSIRVAHLSVNRFSRAFSPVLSRLKFSTFLYFIYHLFNPIYYIFFQFFIFFSFFCIFVLFFWCFFSLVIYFLIFSSIYFPMQIFTSDCSFRTWLGRFTSERCAVPYAMHLENKQSARLRYQNQNGVCN